MYRMVYSSAFNKRTPFRAVLIARTIVVWALYCQPPSLWKLPGSFAPMGMLSKFPSYLNPKPEPSMSLNPRPLWGYTSTRPELESLLCTACQRRNGSLFVGTSAYHPMQRKRGARPWVYNYPALSLEVKKNFIIKLCFDGPTSEP